MTTLAHSAPRARNDDRFFLNTALLMAAIIVAGFSLQLAMGRSSFASPLRVHLHAVVMSGWVVIFVAQTALVASGSLTLHRRLGWIGAGWVVAMIVTGFVVTIAMVRNGSVPFFFTPLQFLVFDPVSMLTFAGLTAAAIVNRHRTDWHRRLHLCGTAMLLGPAFGRLMPMPLLAPYAFEATAVAILLFLLGVMVADRPEGRTHPAWGWGIATFIGSTLFIEALAFGPLGPPIYDAVVAGSPGAAVDPYAFPPPPASPLITGR
ncbi:MAG: hypothetical protein ACKVOP_08010 [Sphingomonadaceae bacterium]